MATYDLDAILELYSQSTPHRQRVYQRTLLYVQDEVVWHRTGTRGRGNKCDLRVTQRGYDTIARLLNLKNTAPGGTVYGFRHLLHPSIIKIGKTTDWKQRKRGYHGLNKVGTMLFIETVSNRHAAERTVLSFMRTANLFTSRLDLGLEYFESATPQAVDRLIEYVRSL